MFFNSFEKLKEASIVSQLYKHLRLIDQRKIDDLIYTQIYVVALHDLRFQINKNDYLQLKREIKNKIV
jgi:hypothetical protein